MRSIGRAWGVGVAALMLVGALPGGAGAQSVDCAAPELDRIDAELVVAHAAVAAGNADALRAAVDSARAQLDAIAAACWGDGASPVPSLPPVDLGGSGTIGDRPLAYPTGLVEIAEGLMRPVDREGVRADVLTVADSTASGELMGSQLEAPVPAGFRALSLAVGDPIATFTSVGLMEPDVVIPSDPVGALLVLVAAAEENGGGSVVVSFGSVAQATYPDLTDGATVDLTIEGEDGTVFATGLFALRLLPDGDWALGVGIAPADATEPIRAELLATLASIGEPA